MKTNTSNPIGRLAAALALFSALHLSAVAQRISGTVLDTLGNPIPRATITEVGPSHRILSTGRTDAAGIFNMRLRQAGESRLRINATGYGILTQRSRVANHQTFVLQRPRTSMLDCIMQAHADYRQNYLLSEGLFCGLSSAGRYVPWTTMVELVGDSTFLLRLPVHASSANAVYAEGRSIAFLNKGQLQILVAFNGKDATPLSGSPSSVDTWMTVAHQEGTKSARMLTNGTSSTLNQTELYFYPAFIISNDEMQQLIQEAENLYMVLVDNEQADNCWNVYPCEEFSKELKRVVKKLQDKASRQHEGK